mmetsp:Transcript_2352/g.5493  ORF Transcript_2352/g.5493 Transcript_2352/m.5493 type:complete len:417 (-) Transcript_2352:688-1938(-)
MPRSCNGWTNASCRVFKGLPAEARARSSVALPMSRASSSLAQCAGGGSNATLVVVVVVVVVEIILALVGNSDFSTTGLPPQSFGLFYFRQRLDRGRGIIIVINTIVAVVVVHVARGAFFCGKRPHRHGKRVSRGRYGIFDFVAVIVVFVGGSSHCVSGGGWGAVVQVPSVVVVVVEQDLALERAAITHHRDAIKRHDATPHRDRGISVPLLRPSASKRQTPTEIPPQDVVAPHHQMGETTVLHVVERIQKHDDPFTRQERPQRRGHEFGFGGRVERGGEFFEKCGGRRRGGGSGRGGGGRGRDRRGRGRSRRMDVGVGRRRVDRRRWRRGTPSEGRRPVMMIFPMQHLLPLLIGNDGWLPWHVARPSGMLTVTRGSGSRRRGPRDGPAVEHRGLGVLHGALDGRRGARGEGCEVGR